MRKIGFLAPIFLGAIILLPIFSLANIGVGVNIGKIIVDQDLNSGMSFELPPFTVLNTGDEPSNYKVSISYLKDQKELRPDKDWVKFSPESFYLEPGKGQIVNMRISLPIITEPGEYFAYLEARPEATQNAKGTSIGVAAATKLYFTVTPGNVFVGIYYKITSFYKNLLPWSNIFLALVVFAGIISILRKYIHLEIKANHRKSPIKNIEDFAKDTNITDTGGYNESEPQDVDLLQTDKSNKDIITDKETKNDSVPTDLPKNTTEAEEGKIILEEGSEKQKKKKIMRKKAKTAGSKGTKTSKKKTAIGAKSSQTKKKTTPKTES
jgi:hypothetical protein